MDKKEAMKILKDFHDKSALFSVRTALDTIIPELRGNDDERIRKELIEYFKHYSGGDALSIKFLEWIDWLEKQGEKPQGKTATKEQRDTLMKAMADAGYTFDFESKELKKIEGKIEIPFVAKDSELQEVTYYISKGFHAEIDDDKVVIKKGEKPTTLSEEDGRMLDLIIAVFEVNHPNGYFKANELNDPNRRAVYTKEIVDWLKALKQRITNKQ